MLAAEALAVGAGPHAATDLRRDDQVVAVPACGKPAADDELGVAAVVAGDPARVDVGGVDEVAAGGDEGIEDGEGLGLVGGPAELHAAHTQA